MATAELTSPHGVRGGLRRYLPLLAAVPVATGAVLLLTADEPVTVAAVARVSGGELCLRTGDGSSACLDAGHRDHLPVGGVADGDCVDVTFVGDRPTNATVVGVRAGACPPGASR